MEENVCLFSDKLTLNLIKNIKPDFIISYNYIYKINEEIILYMKNKIINLHISLLPWNRGSHPNIWSFIDETPKGVTIHAIAKEIDQGDILLQKEIVFDLKTETLESSYNILHKEMQQLFKENWENIKSNMIVPYKQQGKGSFHLGKEIEKFKEMLNYKDTIEKFLSKISELK